MLSRQVSWLAGQCCCPAFPKPFGLSDFVGQRLAAYSCGGSSGFGFFGRTGFPLSFGKTLSEEPRRVHLPARRRARQLDRQWQRVAAVVHSFDRKRENFCARRAGAIDTMIQIAPHVAVTVRLIARFGG
jgi:hypothetical protein